MTERVTLPWAMTEALCYSGGDYTWDMEDDDPDCGVDEGEPDFSNPRPGWGAGCEISDPDFEHDGREHEDGV